MSWRRIQERAAAQPAVTAIVLYAIVACGAFVAAYYGIFSQFAPYDDEGTLLITLKAFIHGDHLYAEIWSVYGPFYYELFGGIFKLFGIPVTTDASRTIVLLVWIGSSVLFGVTAQRLTGRLALGLTSMIAAFAALGVLANEPMHPQGLCVLLLAVFALAAVSGLGGRVGWSGLLCGALLGALLLTKVNLGIFAIAGTAVAAAVTIEPIYRLRWLRWVLVAAFLVMPVAILSHDLTQSWVRELALLEVLAGLAVLIAARVIRPTRGEDDGGTWRWVLAAIAGFLAAFVVILAIVLLTGPSPSAVYQGVVKDALEIRNFLVVQFIFPAGAALDWAIAAVAAAAIAATVRLSRTDAGRALWTGLVRALVGVVILCSVAHIVPVGLNPPAGNPVVLPMLLAWIVAIPPLTAAEPPFKRFLRALLPLVAIAETLQVYPVAGSQVGIASASFVAVGALCVADGLTDLRAWSEARQGAAVGNLAASTAVLAIALPAVFGLNAIVLAAGDNLHTYRDQPGLDLPGAGLMHLGPPQHEEYDGLVALLHEKHCSTFVGWPSLNSLYLWAGLEAPRPTIPNGWFYAMTEAQQRLAVEELRSSTRPCAIVNEELAAGYLRGEPVPTTPLVEYVRQNFRPAARIGPFEFEVPKPSATDGG
ncbi:MAG TPA: hypothetical protein VMF55_03880 [Solirubrobacterales bacterium]|nr:hypothetical protein [Solirubrobacterales bacterium]